MFANKEFMWLISCNPFAISENHHSFAPEYMKEEASVCANWLMFVYLLSEKVTPSYTTDNPPALPTVPWKP